MSHQRRQTSLQIIALTLLALIAVAGCSSGTTQTNGTGGESMKSATEPPDTAVPTATAAPTETPAPTDTPVPTPTTAPTQAPTAAPTSVNAALEGTWRVTHEEGSLVCPEITVDIPASEPEEMNIELRDSGEVVYVENLSGDNLSAERTGDHTFETAITTEGETLYYTLVYKPQAQAIEGMITATITDPELGSCDLARSFSAVPAS